MTRLHSLQCMVWTVSAVVFTFMLISVGKLHNRYERKQAASPEFYPEGRRVLSVQHQSKDAAVPFRVPPQRLEPDTNFDTVQLPRGNEPVLFGEHIEADDTKQVRSATRSKMAYEDKVIAENTADDLSYFEELDGFNYVANKEKQESARKLSNNIKMDGDKVVMEARRPHHHHRNDHASPHLQQLDNNHWSPAERHDKSQLDQEEALHQDDFDDIPLHEQQLLERNIVQHKPIKPNLPPEDENYDTLLSNSQHNAPPPQFPAATQERQPVKTSAADESTGNHFQSQGSHVGNSETDLRQQENQMKSKPQEAGNLNLDMHDSLQMNTRDASKQKQNLQGDQFRLWQSKSNSPPEVQRAEHSNNLMEGKENSDFHQSLEVASNSHLDNVQLVDKIIQEQNETHPHQYQRSSKPRKRRKKKRNKRKFQQHNTTATHSLPIDLMEQEKNGNHDPSASPVTAKPSVLNIFMKPNGRFGNQMFEVASLYGIARRTGRKPFMSRLSDIYQIFPGANKTVAKGEASDDLGVLFEEKPGVFSSDLFSLPPTDLMLCCYFQSWKYFDGYESDIKKMFHFKGRIRKLARTILNKATDVFLTHLVDQTNQEDQGTYSVTYVGVHVRRGDLQLEHHVRRGYRPAPLAYFHKAMNYYRQHFSNVLFLVTSDDMEWCKVKLGSADVFFVERQHEAVDLAVLSLTNHTVISVGTFSWWAAWLAGGQAIYYKHWLKPNSEVAQSYKYKDYFLPKWRAMGD